GEWSPCVIIAASTGGPAALLALLPQLRPDLPVAVVIVQHMPAPYTRAFAGELAARCAMPAREATDGGGLQRRVIYVCPGSHHLTLAPGGRIVLHAPATRDSECPSADLAMMSVARRAGARTIGVVLTGMGRDGAAGARAIRRAGGMVIAQDEATSVVFGMPRAAAEAGAVTAVLPLDDIPSMLNGYVDDIMRPAKRARPAV